MYSLLSSHGVQEVTLHFASKLKDDHRILEQHLLDCNYKEALAVLRQSTEVELIYAACPVLMQHEPKDTVDLLIGKASKLQLNRIMPLVFAALSDGDPPLAEQIIRFVEHCAYSLDSKDRSLHTLLFSLYIRYQPDRTLPYLNGQGILS